VSGVGILPAGALGMSLFYHLTDGLQRLDGSVFFLERAGSASAAALRERGEFCVIDEDGSHTFATERLLKPDLLHCFEANRLPEVLLVCPNPDQLTGVIGSLVNLLERIYREGGLDAALWFPTVVLCSNGIYFQRLRLWYLEKLEESVLFGRLPDLWPDHMPAIMARLLRGVTMQTGIRQGSGGATIYRPGPRGITRIAGGDPRLRVRCCRALTERGGWYESAEHDSATRLEFDKAMLNLSTNLLGQLYAIDDQGRFTSLSIGDMIDGRRAEAIRELCGWIFRIGLAVKAYEAGEDFEVRLGECMAALRLHQTHVPSSLQWIGLRCSEGTLEAKLAPTEAWLLGPLIRYARGANLEDAARYLEDLKHRLLDKLRLAVECRKA
jgi:hypothetical protein